MKSIQSYEWVVQIACNHFPSMGQPLSRQSQTVIKVRSWAGRRTPDFPPDVTEFPPDVTAGIYRENARKPDITEKDTQIPLFLINPVDANMP